MTSNHPLVQSEPVYVLSFEQMRDALVAGAVAANIVPKELGSYPCRVQVVGNGVVLKFDESVELDARVASLEKTTAPVSVGEPQLASTDDLAPAVVKDAIAPFFQRPPSISSIRSWSSSQRQQAMQWARKAKRAQGKNEDRPRHPEFIVERAARGSRAQPNPGTAPDRARVARTQSTTTLISAKNPPTNARGESDILYDDSGNDGAPESE